MQFRRCCVSYLNIITACDKELGGVCKFHKSSSS